MDSAEADNVEVTFEAEVYTFGAVLFAVWSKQWPVNYQADPRQLKLDQILNFIGNRTARNTLPDNWPNMARLIESMLEHEASNRPTMAEVQDNLTSHVME